MTAKLLLADFNGKPVRHYLATEYTLPTKAEAVPAPAHHIVVVDRSGSMYHSIAELRSMIEKLLTLTEFKDPNQRVSLISYSSSGDVKLHFGRVLVEHVMSAANPYLQEIRSLEVTGLTCISQALSLASSVAVAGEATMISLHSDGYANHLSPGTEARAIDAALDKINGLGNVTVNTIAYSDYCDFAMLDRVANKGGGVCVRSRTIAGVYEALYNTQKLLAGTLTPAVKVPVDDNDYVVAFSLGGKKILGSDEDIVLRGFAASDDLRVFRFKEVSAADYEASKATKASPEVVAAFARTLLARGDILDAKYVVSGAGLRSLLTDHYRALTSSALADFAEALEDTVFSVKAIAGTEPGLGFTGPNVLDTLAVFSANPDGVIVHLPTLRNGYSRKGVKKIAGTRNADGTITPPTTKLAVRDAEWVKVVVDVSNTEATAQIRVALDADLVTADGMKIAEVAGIFLDKLKSYANYTLISDGVVNIPVLRVRVVTKAAHSALAALGFNLGDFDPNKVVDLELGKLAVTGFDSQVGFPRSGSLLRLAVQKKIADAIASVLKAEGAATPYTPEQIQALKAVNVTAAGYYSAPTTVPYTDLDAAVKAGEIDYRTSYQVQFGNTKILNLADLYSANEYLQRRFTLSVEQEGKRVDIEKPTFSYFFDPTAEWGEKTLSARTKLNEVDDLMFPIMAAVLGIVPVDPETPIAGLRKLETALDAAAVINDAMESLYRDYVRPLVMFTATTGIVPPSFGFTPMTPDEFGAKFGVKVPKALTDATFFVDSAGDVMTVAPQLKPFSAKAITAADE